MHVVTVVFEIRPEAQSAFLPLMLDNARMSLAEEPGCLRFDVCQDEGRPSRIFLYEVYRDKAAFEAHLNSAQFTSFNLASASMVVDKRVEAWALLSPDSELKSEQWP